MAEHRIYSMEMAKIYDLYLKKVERKGRSEKELREVLLWLTGFTDEGLEEVLEKKVSLREFFERVPKLHENANLVTGSICGVKIGEIQDPLMKKIRIMDKLVDELAKGKAMEKIFRK